MCSNGGVGGTTNAPTPGDNIGTGALFGGGGGGAAGHIRVNTTDGVFAPSGATISPPATTGKIQTR
jgi:hypothetical protein